MSGNISDPSTWAPPNESPLDLWTERSNFVSVPLSSAAYGIHLTLFLIVFHHLLAHPSPSNTSARHRKPSWYLIAYISTNFILGTFGIAAEARFNELTFVDDRNYPGGPNAFVVAQYGDFINIFGTAAYVVLNWLADGLVIYRFWLIYSFNPYIILLPTLLLLTSISMGCILLFQLTQPDANLWTHTALNFSLPYFSISIALNILVTTLIVARLLYIRAQTRRALTSAHAKTYTSIMAMLVESAALYSVTAIIFIVTYARNNNVQNLVLPVLGQVQAISPLLIMWRVALGQAWTRDTYSFATGSTNGSPQYRDGNYSGSKISWNRNVSTGRYDLSANSGFGRGGAGGRRRAGTTGTDFTGTEDEFTMSTGTGAESIPIPNLPMGARHRAHHHHQGRKLTFLSDKPDSNGSSTQIVSVDSVSGSGSPVSPMDMDIEKEMGLDLELEDVDPELEFDISQENINLAQTRKPAHAHTHSHSLSRSISQPRLGLGVSIHTQTHTSVDPHPISNATYPRPSGSRDVPPPIRLARRDKHHLERDFRLEHERSRERRGGDDARREGRRGGGGGGARVGEEEY